MCLTPTTKVFVLQVLHYHEVYLKKSVPQIEVRLFLGTLHDSLILFLVHTFLSTLVKILLEKTLGIKRNIHRESHTDCLLNTFFRG